MGTLLAQIMALYMQEWRKLSSRWQLHNKKQVAAIYTGHTICKDTKTSTIGLCACQMLHDWRLKKFTHWGFVQCYHQPQWEVPGLIGFVLIKNRQADSSSSCSRGLLDKRIVGLSIRKSWLMLEKLTKKGGHSVYEWWIICHDCCVWYRAVGKLLATSFISFCGHPNQSREGLSPLWPWGTQNQSMNNCEGCRAQKIQNPLHQTFNAQKKKGAVEPSGQSDLHVCLWTPFYNPILLQSNIWQAQPWAARNCKPPQEVSTIALASKPHCSMCSLHQSFASFHSALLDAIYQ